MSLNAVVSIQDEIMRLTELCEKIGRMRGLSKWEINPEMFKHTIQARTALVNATGDAQVLLYTVPANTDFILTYINLRALSVVTSTPVSSDEVFGFFGGVATGIVLSARLRKNGGDLTLPGVTYIGLANRPVLFVFNSGDVVGLVVNASTIVSGGINVPGSISGFEVPSGTIAPRLAGMQTKIANPNTVFNGVSQGTSANNITVTNTVF